MFNKKNLLILALILLVGTISKSLTLRSPISPSSSPTPQSETQVLSHSTNSPRVFISGGNNAYSSGGVVTLASTDEPSIEMTSYNASGTAEINLYKTTEAALLSYLVHDKDYEQIQTQPDSSQLELVTTLSQQIGGTNNRSESTTVLLPLEQTGIWYATIKLSEVTVNAFIVRSPIGVVVKEGDNQLLFWA